MNIRVYGYDSRWHSLEVKRKEEEAEDVTLVGGEESEEPVKEVVVVDEAHEDGTETDRGELVSHTCSVEVLAHTQKEDQTQSQRTWLYFQGMDESACTEVLDDTQ